VHLATSLLHRALHRARAHLHAPRRQQAPDDDRVLLGLAVPERDGLGPPSSLRRLAAGRVCCSAASPFRRYRFTVFLATPTSFAILFVR
jgi:hypothetical protein